MVLSDKEELAAAVGHGLCVRACRAVGLPDEARLIPGMGLLVPQQLCILTESPFVLVIHVGRRRSRLHSQAQSLEEHSPVGVLARPWELGLGVGSPVLDQIVGVAEARTTLAAFEGLLLATHAIWLPLA